MRVYFAVVPVANALGSYSNQSYEYYHQAMLDHLCPVLEISHDKRFWTPAERRACAQFLRWCHGLQHSFMGCEGAYTCSNLNSGSVVVFVPWHRYEGGSVLPIVYPF